MLRYGKIEWPRDVWGNILKPGNPTIYEPNIRDIGRVHPSVLGTCKVQRDWCKRMQPFSTALALGLLATRIRARHGSFEDARAAWRYSGHLLDETWLVPQLDLLAFAKLGQLVTATDVHCHCETAARA